MRKLLDTVVIIVVLLICTIVVAIWILPTEVGVAMFLFWAVASVILIGVHLIVSSRKSAVTRLRNAPKHGSFSKEVETLVNSYMSISTWGSRQHSVPRGSSLERAYEIIVTQMDNIMESSTRYIESYDYFMKPYPRLLVDWVQESVQLVEKLHELQDLALQIDDSVGDAEVSRVDDLIDSLKQMQR